MKKSILTLTLCFPLFYIAQSEEKLTEITPIEVTDRLTIPGPITFGGNEFFLVWSKQNSTTWAQQQYIQRDDDINNFKELINISYFDKEIDMDDAAKAKVKYVESRKEKSQDKYSFVSVTESPDGKEMVVDYLITATPKDGESYAEYSMDRFKSYDNGGKKSFVIFTYAKRLVGDLKYSSKSLTKERSRLMEAIITTQIPNVTYKPTEVEKKK